MKQLKAISVLLSVLAMSLAFYGCSPEATTPQPTSPADKPLNTIVPTSQLPATAKPTAQPPDEIEPPPTIEALPEGPVEGERSPGEPQTPITTKLLLSQVPLLGETAELTFTISTINDASDITAVINLPGGAALVSGETTWEGQLKGGQSQTLHAVIKFHSEGDWILEAKALSPQSTGDVWGDASYIYLHVAEDGSHLGFEPAGNNIEEGVQDTSPPSVDPAPPP